MKRSWMKKSLALLLCLAVSVGLVTPALAAEADSFLESMNAAFRQPEMEYRPEARWWLAEGSHTDETLIESIHELYDSGFGALEFLTLDESAYLDDKTYAWGSEEWIHDSHLIMREATKLGMGVSFTSGTHWSTANLMNITPDDETASQELSYRTVELAAGETFAGPLPVPTLPDNVTKAKFTALVAARRTGADSMTLVEESLTDVTHLAKEENGVWTASYTAPTDGAYILFAFWQHGTGENYQPAVTGKSFTINYFDKAGAEALIEYWDAHVLDEEMKALILENGDVSMYMDSLELKTKGANSTNNNWAADFPQEFENRTGYSMIKYLPILIMTNPGGWGANVAYAYELEGEELLAAKIRRDLFQVNTELYQEECLDVLTNWLHKHGITLRAENSYGKLLEISQPIKNVDYVEMESLEFGSELDSYRSMSGGAHVYGKTFSSETGALVAENYVKSPWYFRQLFYTQFAAGIQRTVVHGYSSAYGPEQNVSWPGYEGMQPMFSERFNKRQPASIDYPAQMGEHVARIQKVLRQGAARMDLAILRTDYNIDNNKIQIQNGYMIRHEHSEARFHKGDGFYWRDQGLQYAGFTYDYFSPALLEDVVYENGVLQPETAGYQAVLIYQEELPYESAVKLLEWAKAGLPVVLVTGETTEILGTYTRTHRGAALTTGFNDDLDEELAAVMAELKALDTVACIHSQADAPAALAALGVRPRVEHGQPTNRLLTVLREDADASYLYVYNFMAELNETYTGTISLEGQYKPYELDTWSGETTALGAYAWEDGRTVLPVEVDPGDIVIFALDPNGAEGAAVTQTNAERVTVEDGMTVLHAAQTGTLTAVYGDGTAYTVDVEVPEAEFDGAWSLSVESWEPGEKVIREEDRGLGYVTKEATYTTAKRLIEVGETELLPWLQLEAVGGTVSGVGTYSNTFTLPQSWDPETMTLEFDAVSFGEGTAALWVNEQKIPVNMDNGKADLTEAVVPGVNTITVRVATSLRNVMKKVGYSGWFFPQETDHYGMIGQPTLELCVKVPVAPANAATVELTGRETAMVEEALQWTVLVSDVTDLATATLCFRVDGLNAPAVEAAEGWYVIAQWQEDGILTAVLGNNEGLTAESPAALAHLTAEPAGRPGTATAELEAATLSVYLADREAFQPVILANSTVETVVDYSIYDVNRDGTVNQLDITRAQRSFGGNDALADVNDDGTVDITDFVLILNNYSK